MSASLGLSGTSFFKSVLGALACLLLCTSAYAGPSLSGVEPLLAMNPAYGQNGLPTEQPRFTDNGDGTVTDNRSGLTWLKDAECLGMQTWEGAKDLAARISHGHTCNSFTLNDNSSPGEWRVPTIREIMTLPVIEYFSPALSNAAGTGKWTEGDPFVNVSSLYYWSGTRVGENNAWYMYLYNGVLGLADIAQKYHVWPVKGELKHLWRLGS